MLIVWVIDTVCLQSAHQEIQLCGLYLGNFVIVSHLLNVFLEKKNQLQIKKDVCVHVCVCLQMQNQEQRTWWLHVKP